MKISTQTRYAMRFLVELALYESKAGLEDRLTTHQIAQKQGISGKYLESIACKLKKAGFVSSLKGVKGGYRLAQPLEEISVGQVMRVMETTYFELHCVKNPEETCPNYEACKLVHYWSNLEEAISCVVDTVMLKDIKDEIDDI